MSGLFQWKFFWLFWLGGLVFFVGIIATNGFLVTDVAPGGMSNHQGAATADQVNAIQQSWAEAGRMNFAKWSMIADLVFIGLYSVGGIIGGRLIWQHARSPSLKKLGLFCVLAIFLFGFFDYVETISQIAQLLQNEGNNALAAIAATAGPPKVITWITGTIGLITALIWYWQERRA